MHSFKMLISIDIFSSLQKCAKQQPTKLRWKTFWKVINFEYFPSFVHFDIKMTHRELCSNLAQFAPEIWILLSLLIFERDSEIKIGFSHVTPGVGQGAEFSLQRCFRRFQLLSKTQLCTVFQNCSLRWHFDQMSPHSKLQSTFWKNPNSFIFHSVSAEEFLLCYRKVLQNGFFQKGDFTQQKSGSKHTL